MAALFAIVAALGFGFALACFLADDVLGWLVGRERRDARRRNHARRLR